jgi:predicted transposase YbfD/YdcC
LKHPLIEIIFLTISAVISGCETYKEIAEFGYFKLQWLRKFYPYKHKTPSHDTLGAVFSTLDHQEFSKHFVDYIQFLADKDSRVIAIDGKSINGSPFHIVSAFCQANKLCLNQILVDSKSNEITAIPPLLDLLTLDNCIVTIDAMGCQKEIASKIIEKNADYILQVKENQKTLLEQVKRLFSITSLKDEATTLDLDHGRIEKRTCRIINDLTFLDEKSEWNSLTTVIEIESNVEHKKYAEKSHSKRYYISSLDKSAKETLKAIRQHWSIENNLHWCLDVIFKEDNQLKRKGNSVQNFNLISKICLGLLEKEQESKKSNKLKRKAALLSDEYREKLLNL